MRPLAAAMGQHVGAVAAGVFEGVGEDRKPVEGMLSVDAAGQAADGGGPPRIGEGDTAEGRPEHVADELDLGLAGGAVAAAAGVLELGEGFDDVLAGVVGDKLIAGADGGQGVGGPGGTAAAAGAVEAGGGAGRPDGEVVGGGRLPLGVGEFVG